MKTRLLKSILALLLTFMALPMMGQDFMNVYFKDGKLRTFHLDNVKEFKTSKVDADGVMHFDYDYQHIETHWEKHVYALSNVDSITFTKYNPQTAKENTVSAMTSVMPILKDCYTITDVSKKMDEIKQAQSVETAWIEGDVLFVKIKDWQTVKFYFDQYLDTDTSNISTLVNYIKADASSRQINDVNGEKLKAIVANQQHFDNSWSRIQQRENFMYPLRDKFVNAGYRAKYDSIPNLDFFLDEMYDYDIVFLSTHGGYSAEEGHSFVSGRKLAECLKDADLEVRRQTSSEASAAYESVFQDERFADSRDHLGIGWVYETKTVNGITGRYIVGYVDINESFFSNIVTREFTNPKSLMFNTACHSMQDSYELGDILRRDRKLGTYLGYTQSNYFGQEAGCTMLMNMLDGISAEKAYEDLGSHPLNALGQLYDDRSQDHINGTYKDEDIARIDLNGNTLNQYFANLILYPDNDAQRPKRFITPVFTSEIDHDEAMEQYKTDHGVILWATTTTMDKDKLSMGFRYGTSKNNLNNDLAAEMVLKTLDTGKGNYRFTAKLKNVDNRQTYYFCAYTSDGQYFNYGDTCDIFSEPADLELSAGSFCINQGENTTIDITSGNGEYDIYNGNNKVTKVTLDGEKLIIEAIGAGESTIIVTDKKTGQTAPLKVTVWARLSVAIIGNIDLEVGDKANVRIMSGNNDYTLESSDPKVATPSLIGEFVSVEALSAGTATITVTDNKTGQTASFTVTVTDSTPVDIPAAAVDLGLPSGTLWANKNVGAASPENGGLYFAWGEIVGYGSDAKDGRLFDWDSYKWDNFTKYCSASWVAELGMGIVDNKTILDPEDDAATANWGENWRMPTYDEFRELLEYTTNDYATLNGESGRVYKSLTNGNSIFLPFTGYRADDFVQKGWAYYWSSTQVADKPDLAYNLTVDGGHTQCGTGSRVRGFLVRPVFCGDGGQLPTYDNLQLSTYDPIIMNVNAGLTFMILSGSGSYAVESSKEAVATATLRDNYVDVSGVGAGTATITVIDINTGQKKTREVTVIDYTPLTDTPAEAIDLGLPSGTLWASFNVGATKPEEYGGYYSWGEIVEKDSYEWSDYLYCDGSVNTCKELGMDIAGTQYDIAHVKWGGDWRMPTYDQQQELVNNTKFKYVTSNGIKGYELVGPNGNSIFLPASGIIQGNRPNVGSLGGYWSSTRDPEDPNYACNLLFRNTGSYEVFYYRCIGLSVRPVISGSQQSVPNLALESTAPLSLKARQKTGINIISGSGNYTAKSDDESVATADISDWVSLETGEKGKCVNVNAVGVGLTTITVTDVQSLQQVSIRVTVTQNVDLLKLSVSSLELKVGEIGDVVITSSSGAEYLVASSDANVATFSIDKATNTIKVLAVGVGTCKITVNDSETGETATVIVTVTAGSENEASITFHSAEILEVSPEPKYNGDGEYLFTWYTTKFKYVIKIDGADMIDYIQPIIYDNGTWAYNGGKSRVPGNGMYSVTTSMSYDNDANMNWATGYLIALKDGTTIYSTNILQFGGTPESPTVIVSASTPKLSKPKKMKKPSVSVGSKPTFGNMGLEKLR